MAFRSNLELLGDHEYTQAHPEPSTSIPPSPTSKDNAIWMEPSRYITSAEASNLDSSLDPATQLLIDRAAASIAANMLEQLEQAALVSYQYTGNVALMQGRNNVDVYDRVVRDSFHTGLLHALSGMGGIKTPTIIIDVTGFLDGENELTAALKRSNFSLVPARLIQTSERPLTREATASFAAAFSTAVRGAFASQIEALTDIRPGELFIRQQMLHKGKHDIGENVECCLFKISEEDYRMPFDKSTLDNNAYKYVKAQTKEVADEVFKHMVAEFSIKCSTCRMYHDFKVVR
ncbi:hypothetical protein DPSP01_000132 [Paraphaeosphaeria sporulosa]|uniref:Uncharacterized protein n=1 Tax=Paraphaeosphaeria sporulosa TaxID=1460663 RepID=A0A177D1D7_9PLEO|nr:uncharacterized protein CC84DRAFT_1212419 [Paraphaeosphaeria sporulosa]OAG12940.1 hypothetical protein CC84DRAFT_1212419 [Paraphaeosphaeria sporulosa]